MKNKIAVHLRNIYCRMLRLNANYKQRGQVDKWVNIKINN